MSQRIDRIDELLREEISVVLARDVADPAVGFVTVTRVDTSPDLAHARVWVSLIGQPNERASTLAALRRAMPFVRHLLGGRVRLRRIPELHVEVDESVERGTRVLQLLHELESGQVPEELPPPGESLPTPASNQRSENLVSDRPRRPRQARTAPARGGRDAGRR
jgi:ribosome-binding factor A